MRVAQVVWRLSKTMATAPNLLGAFAGYTQGQTAKLSFTKSGSVDVDAWRTHARTEAKRFCISFASVASLFFV